MVIEYPVEAAVLASLVLSEILEAGLYADDETAALGDFVQAVNARLDEIALRRRAAMSWRLVPSDLPRRH